MKADWEKEITLDDLPPDFRGLAEKIGLADTLEVIRYFEGSEKYFPKIESAFKVVRDRIIQRKWKKHNVHDLATEFDLTDNQIRNIVNDHEDQIDLVFPS